MIHTHDNTPGSGLECLACLKELNKPPEKISSDWIIWLVAVVLIVGIMGVCTKPIIVDNENTDYGACQGQHC